MRYSGTHPRKFAEKYKEQRPERYPEDVAKVLEAGKTPAGMHRPIMVREVMEALDPRPGEIGADVTLGYGGHARELLARLQPGGQLVGLDADPLQLPKTEARLRGLGYGEEAFIARRSNFAGLAKILGELGWAGVDVLLADLGVSSMQLDDPARGFSAKLDGPLDMRMNPQSGTPAARWIEKSSPGELLEILRENADEPNAELLAKALAGQSLASTGALASLVRKTLGRRKEEEVELSLRRVFQALRIAVNDELGALDALLRSLPGVLRPGGRVAFLAFHSGEDRRVKKALAAGLREGFFAETSAEVIRPGAEECGANPRARSAKLRWGKRAG